MDTWGALDPTTVANEDMVTAMMNEIQQRGPIVCGIDATPVHAAVNFDPKKIFDDAGTEIDHDISVVGWSTLNGEAYWIVRNSWGSTWGDDGFF